MCGGTLWGPVSTPRSRPCSSQPEGTVRGCHAVPLTTHLPATGPRRSGRPHLLTQQTSRPLLCPGRPPLPIGQAGPQAPRRASRAPGAASCVHGDGHVAREGSGGRQAPHAPVHARSHMHTHYTHAHTCTPCTHANRRTHIRLAESNTQTQTHARHTRGRARPGSAPSAPAEEPLGSWV